MGDQLYNVSVNEMYTFSIGLVRSSANSKTHAIFVPKFTLRYMLKLGKKHGKQFKFHGKTKHSRVHIQKEQMSDSNQF